MVEYPWSVCSWIRVYLKIGTAELPLDRGTLLGLDTTAPLKLMSCMEETERKHMHKMAMMVLYKQETLNSKICGNLFNVCTFIGVKHEPLIKHKEILINCFFSYKIR